MRDDMEIEAAGQRWRLLPQGGLFWPERRILVVADTHLGKEASFRRHLIPVPEGATKATLQCVSQMLTDTQAATLIFLGDLFHASTSASRQVLAEVDRFFEVHAHVRFQLTIGNHDRHLGKLLERWPLEVSEAISYGHIELAHHPMKPTSRVQSSEADPSDCGSERRHILRICGHLHPAIRAATAADSLQRLPCFWMCERQFILPAVGQFTGTQLISPKPEDRLWLIAEQQVVEYRHNAQRTHSRRRI